MKPGVVEWERFAPSSVRAFGPATFPGGEGFLRRGLFIPVRPGPVGVPSTPAACGRHPLQAGEGGGCLRRGRGGTGSGPCTAPHPSRLRRSTLSQERVCSFTRQGFALPPSPKERVFICPRGSLRIRACLCSGLLPSLPGGLPAPRRPWPPAHTPRGKRKWGRSSRSGPLRPGGCHRSA